MYNRKFNSDKFKDALYFMLFIFIFLILHRIYNHFFPNDKTKAVKEDLARFGQAFNNELYGRFHNQQRCLGLKENHLGKSELYLHYQGIAWNFCTAMHESPSSSWYDKLWENEQKAMNSLNSIHTLEEFMLVNHLVYIISGKSIEQIMIENGNEDSWFKRMFNTSFDSWRDNMKQKEDVWTKNTEKSYELGCSGFENFNLNQYLHQLDEFYELQLPQLN